LKYAYINSTKLFEKGYDQYNINELAMTVINSTLKLYDVDKSKEIVDLDIILEHGDFIRNIIIEFSERLQKENLKI
jgi:hypothetical protein